VKHVHGALHAPWEIAATAVCENSVKGTQNKEKENRMNQVNGSISICHVMGEKKKIII